MRWKSWHLGFESADPGSQSQPQRLWRVVDAQTVIERCLSRKETFEWGLMLMARHPTRGGQAL